MYDAGGSTYFGTTNGPESYVAKTPYEDVTAYSLDYQAEICDRCKFIPRRFN
jgi:hypothetical protein